MLSLAIARNFVVVEVLTYLGALAYTPAFIVQGDWTQNQATCVATLLFLEFGAALFVAARRGGDRLHSRLVLSTVNTIVYISILETLLSGTTLAAMLLALAVVQLCAALQRGVGRELRSAYGWLAIASVTLAAPAFSTGITLSEFWAVEAAFLVSFGASMCSRTKLVAGIVLFVAALFETIVHVHLGERTPLLNERFVSLVIFAGALAVAVRSVRANLNLNDAGTITVVGARLIVHLAALAACGMEISDQLGGLVDVGLSVLWSLYAIALCAYGLRAHDTVARWFGLTLFGCTLIKVFAVDLASIDLVYRTVSFMVLGAALVGVSIAYQRWTGSFAVESNATPEASS
ncbi:MAG TPA: DUF2339 domain-containing protein [Candidatus Baltobacteraceae bacterium]